MCNHVPVVGLYVIPFVQKLIHHSFNWASSNSLCCISTTVLDAYSLKYRHLEKSVGITSSKLTMRGSLYHIKPTYNFYPSRQNEVLQEVIKFSSSCKDILPHHYRFINAFKVPSHWGLFIQQITLLFPVVSVIFMVNIRTQIDILLVLHQTFENLPNIS